MLFQKNDISPTFSPKVGLGLRSKADLEKKIVKYLAFTIYCTQREKMTNQNIFSEKVKKKLEKISLTFFYKLFVLVL